MSIKQVFTKEQMLPLFQFLQSDADGDFAVVTGSTGNIATLEFGAGITVTLNLVDYGFDGCAKKGTRVYFDKETGRIAKMFMPKKVEAKNISTNSGEGCLKERAQQF